MRSLLALLLATGMAYAQPLPDQARFQPGDNPDYARPDYDDSLWPQIRLPGCWERQGYPDLDGYAWLRIHFDLDPQRLPAQPYVLLGNLDDSDETYLNGHKIGQDEYGNQRIYRAPRALFARHNVLAIRVLDSGGEGGLTGGLLGIMSQDQWRRQLNYGPSPKVSFQPLVTSNGCIAAVYDPVTHRVPTVWPHIYKMQNAHQATQPWLEDLRWSWPGRPTSSFYRQNTHVIQVDYPAGTLLITAPFLGDKQRLLLTFQGPPVQLRFRGHASLQQTHSPGRHTFCLSPGPTTSAPQSMDAEVKAMRRLYGRLPDDLSRSQRNLAEQSIAVLKMAQVAPEEGPGPAGQILASLPPGNWNICWMRDASYAILALNRLGLYAESRRALEFFRQARVGQFEHFRYRDGLDHGVGHPYGITVCRYFGDGQEESDVNQDGPNIELDGFGLFLIAASDYVQRSGDRAWLLAHQDWIDDRVAEVILSLQQTDGLIRAESGPWEMHLPGRRQAWTSLVSAAGLRDYATLTGQSTYQEASRRMLQAIQQQFLYQGRMLKGFAEATRPDQPDFYDGGTLEAFSLGLITDPGLFQSHIHEFSKIMRVSPRRGFARLNQPGWYTWSEWPFLALRLAVAYRLQGQPHSAQPLLARITDYAALNHNLIPELYGRSDENYGGAIPMVGYGAAAYILALLP